MYQACAPPRQAIMGPPRPFGARIKYTKDESAHSRGEVPSALQMRRHPLDNPFDGVLESLQVFCPLMSRG